MFGAVPTVPPCASPNQIWDPVSSQCIDTITPCGAGKHTDPLTLACVADQPVQAAMGPIGYAAIVTGLLVGAAALFSRTQKPKRRRRRA